MNKINPRRALTIGNFATGLTVEPGKFYIDGHGDISGPMEARADMWINQHGAVYYGNGIQYNHTHDSAGNLLRAVNEERTKR